MVVFSPSAFQYNQLTVTNGFVLGLPFNDNALTILHNSDEGSNAHWPDNLHFLQTDIHAYENLSVQDCKRAYAQHFIRDRADVVVVVKPKVPDTNASTVITSEAGGIGPWPYQWLCPPDSRQNFDCYRQLFESDGDWNYPGYKDLKVEYCLSMPMKQHCKLQYGFIVAMFTVVANALKVICFVGTYWILKYRPNDIANSNASEKRKSMPLVTTGDAIASFLEFPDQETFGMSIVEKEDFRNGIWDLRWVHVYPMPWRRRFPCAHFRAIGLRQWITGTSLFVTTISAESSSLLTASRLSTIPLIPAIFLLSKIHWLRHDLELNATTINQLGMGKPNALFLFGAWSHIVGGANPLQRTEWIIMGNVALANSPQLVISMAYYLWNSHLTVMFAAREYDLYAAPKKGNQGNVRPPKKRSLRVTYPEEGTDQRSTSFLTIPFKYWAPTAALWTALHWLASQAVFFARVDMLDHWLEVAPLSISQVGYSVLGTIYFFAVSFVVFVFATWISIRKFDNRMPLAATCSGALSAACHPKDLEGRHYRKKVHWGVEYRDDRLEAQINGGDDEIWRCTFTSGEAYYPSADRFYA